MNSFFAKYRQKFINFTIFSGRTPHGVRGLKSRAGKKRAAARVSHPSRGAWIEIFVSGRLAWE